VLELQRLRAQSVWVMPHPTLTTPGGLGVTLADVSRWGVDFDRLQLALDRGNGG
jgi:hypothetical protein